MLIVCFNESTDNSKEDYKNSKDIFSSSKCKVTFGFKYISNKSLFLHLLLIYKFCPPFKLLLNQIGEQRM